MVMDEEVCDRNLAEEKGHVQYADQKEYYSRLVDELAYKGKARKLSGMEKKQEKEKETKK